MKLLVDIGNSRIKWGWLDGTQLGDFGVTPHHGHKLEEVFAQAWRDAPGPSAIVVSNVAGPMANHALNHVCAERFQLTPSYMVSSAQAAGVSSGYRDPARLGVDRWMALIGAFNRHDAPACVIDCGTAITLDAITREGKHLGGLIAPGINAMRHALAGTGAEIEEDAGDGATVIFAHDTHAAVAGGALNAAVGLIERVSARMTAKLGSSTTCLLTGGDAARVLPCLQEGYRLVPNLVLEGLAVMAEQQT
ncbi:MAG TPA: type III pantothenate kinase [Gammaproteobacteria bacterium]|jgi:type III pantothenate kinase|nr:type III pantothenate kinase [Gammaproteobacteria bacterium]